MGSAAARRIPRDFDAYLFVFSLNSIHCLATMKLALPFVLLASASAFAPTVPCTQRLSFVGPVRMSDDTVEAAPAPAPAPPAAKKAPTKLSGGQLVPVKEETVEFAAGLLGGAAGLFLGGPVLALIAAGAANYISKSDGDASEVVSTVSKSSIEVYNYLVKLDDKYEVLDKAKGSLEDAADKLKSSSNVDTAALDKVEKALATTTEKIEEINDEYDLVGAANTALGVVGDLVEKAIKKAGELNEEYALTDKATAALSTAVDKAKEQAGKR